MTVTTMIMGLDMIFFIISMITAIAGMMVIGATMEGVRYIRNPYLRQRRTRFMLTKMIQVFASKREHRVIWNH